MTQITRAMEMVSASKMRRAQRNVLATRPYADRLFDVMLTALFPWYVRMRSVPRRLRRMSWLRRRDQ